jgi:hypothetical protein
MARVHFATARWEDTLFPSSSGMPAAKLHFVSCSDGPSEFHLRKITDFEANGHLENWTGIVELSEK